MGVYRVQAGGAWSSLSDTDQLARVVRFRQALNRALDHRYDRVLRDTAYRDCYLLALTHRQRGSFGKAIRYAAECLRIDPRQARGRLTQVASLLLRGPSRTIG
ncbi:MAG: hypothetical protein ABR599_10930 [Gemmatimonadota bacterium]